MKFKRNLTILTASSQLTLSRLNSLSIKSILSDLFLRLEFFLKKNFIIKTIVDYDFGYFQFAFKCFISADQRFRVFFQVLVFIIQILRFNKRANNRRRRKKLKLIIFQNSFKSDTPSNHLIPSQRFYFILATLCQKFFDHLDAQIFKILQTSNINLIIKLYTRASKILFLTYFKLLFMKPRNDRYI